MEPQDKGKAQEHADAATAALDIPVHVRLRQERGAPASAGKRATVDG